MEKTATVSTVYIDQVHELLVQSGYEVTSPAENVLAVKDLDSGLVISAVLEDNILFCTLPCASLPEAKVNLALTRTLLAAENGISTSSFQIYQRDDGQFTLTLNNFCKLQAMGPDDHDDILSCLEFLEVDAYAAQQLLQGVLA